MKVYFDNVIASAIVRGDLADTCERAALTVLQAPPYVNTLLIVTSRESWREQDHTRNPKVRAQLRERRGVIDVVPNDHRVLGFNAVDLGYRGFISSPLVTDVIDEGIFANLKSMGLRDADARHLMYALCNGCVRFVTTDADFLTRRGAIEAAHPEIHVVKPSELLKELSDNSV